MTAATQQAPTDTITERVADYVVGLRFEDLPSSVAERAKELLVYQFGAAFHGVLLRSTQGPVEAALELSGTHGDCTIIGRRERAQVAEAAFANSALMINSGYFDHLLPSGVIPGGTVHPVAWALGEKLHASGRDVLAAVAVGYDVMAKLHNGVLPYDLVIPRPTKMATEPFGIAAAAAKLLGLTREQTADALGNAGQSVLGIYEGVLQTRLLHAMAARNGLTAAVLAKAGTTGTRNILEGPHGVYPTFFLQDVPDAVRDNVATLGDDFEIPKTMTGPYPVSAANALPFDLTRQLVADHALTPDRVAAIDLVLPEVRAARESIYGTYPQGPSSMVAIALTDGRVDPARFEEPFGTELLAVRDKVQLRFEAGHSFQYARVEITTIDGQRVSAESNTKPLAPPLDWAHWLAAGGQAILTDGQLARLLDLLRSLEDVPDVAEVMACVVPDGSQ